MRPWRANPVVIRWWHVATVLIAATALGIQLVLVVQGTDVLVPAGERPAPTSVRVANFFSYFTVQSNILLAIGAATLAVTPHRDGSAWRVVRLAGLVGITVTGIVYVTLLRPIVELEGVAVVTNIGFHYLTPLLGAVGWWLYGPWPRIDRRTLLWSLVWPVAWLVYTLVRGEIRTWYPYPFIDVAELGYPQTLLNAFGITLLLLGVGVLFLVGDRRLSSRRLGDRARLRPAHDLPSGD